MGAVFLAVVTILLIVANFLSDLAPSIYTRIAGPFFAQFNTPVQSIE